MGYIKLSVSWCQLDFYVAPSVFRNSGNVFMIV